MQCSGGSGGLPGEPRAGPLLSLPLPRPPAATGEGAVGAKLQVRWGNLGDWRVLQTSNVPTISGGLPYIHGVKQKVHLQLRPLSYYFCTKQVLAFC